MARLGARAFLPVLLVFLLAACAGQSINNPALLSGASHAVLSANNPINALPSEPGRVSAALTPESTAMFSPLAGNVALMALYRTYPNGETRFALSMAQGTSLGTCLRTPDGKLEYKIVSPLAVVGDLVRASFEAIDELFAAAPGRRDESSESWSLRLGDSRGGLPKDKIVLLRRKALGGGKHANYVYDLDGRPLVFYRSAGQVLDWRLKFAGTDGKIAYSFKDNKRYWLINVEIMEVSP